MATARKRWPNECEWARLDCISLARRGRQELVGMLDAVESPGLLRSMARVMECLREIEQRLMEVKGE